MHEYFAVICQLLKQLLALDEPTQLRVEFLPFFLLLRNQIARFLDQQQSTLAHQLLSFLGQIGRVGEP